MAKGQKSRSVDTEFMNELQAAAHLKPHATSNLMLFSIAALVAFFLIWANFSAIDEITRGQGQVVPTSEIQILQSLEGGILQELLVTEGQAVTKGQILMRISDVHFSSEERGTEARSRGLRAKRARLQAEANFKPFTLPEDIAQSAPDIAANEQALYTSRQQELRNTLSILDDRIARIRANIEASRAQINRMTSSRTLLNQEMTITAQMVAQKAVPKLEEIRLQRELADLNGQIRAENENLIGLQAELRQIEKERADASDKFRSQALGELNEAETQIAQLEESLKSIGDRVSRAELRAPVDGIVNAISLKTIGGVIEPAQKLVEIVPMDSELKIIARVLPQDIAFMRVGLPAKVRISAYDSQRYGALDGQLARIGASSVSDKDGNVFFEIEVRTDRNYLGGADDPLPITPGMVADVGVITGKRTIMEYLLKPVLRARERAFTES